MSDLTITALLIGDAKPDTCSSSDACSAALGFGGDKAALVAFN